MAIELPVDRRNLRCWIVATAQDDAVDPTQSRPDRGVGNRWLVASRRFVPAMVPDRIGRGPMAGQPTPVDSIVPSVFGCDLDAVRSRLRGHPRGVVLWDADAAEHHAAIFDAIIQLTIARTDVLQFVAAPTMHPDQRLALCEWGVAAIIDRPERLPAWTALVQRFWSRVSAV